MYDNIQYAEFNTRSDFCHICGFVLENDMKRAPIGHLWLIALTSVLGEYFFSATEYLTLNLNVGILIADGMGNGLIAFSI